MKQATRDFFGAQLKARPSLYLVAPVSELQTRASMIAELRRQVRAGTYNPNMRIVAERMFVARS